MEKICISSLTLSELEDLLVQIGEAKYRAKQVYTWLHKQHVQSFEQMTNMPKKLLSALEEKYSISTVTIEKKQVSKDGTVKYLFKLSDSNFIETVVLPNNYCTTICISTQVGCRMGCKFCATGQGGFVRNLTAGEIAAQIYTAQQDMNIEVSNVVMMGMGEPLDNFDSTVAFLRIISSEEGENIGMRHISLSTCGIVPKINELAKLHFGITLSVSLHAPFNDMRSNMMPINDAYPIEVLVDTCKKYQNETGRRVTYEYSMVKGVNDSEKEARALAKLLKGMGAHVNLIPINNVDGSPYSASDAKNVDEFKKTLKLLGLNATTRRRMGEDISAACGQLRAKPYT